ncbi:MAG: amylo-alpha-1,6-glucosidase [Candidatus Woesearchaeota archaeon]|jgi:hypothetical protein|nr:amylo-alpha-1,6-glucosidase [Candidatus Woesearchaeota archaeon]MDP7182130.1 amylo-alpha-1,6-glucosidase [Candidatus Woesearchaeota archaeon]MDP7199281.1 amylo-alpha-1,6-glucosidase [Candidatus Woesearchaeota archaeon]MDP7467902.1 amylo-alpha-1,6-glucosidase [Candidatus Woesearchaeota archaeon]MDP7647892.1 amylo-alpha-1,6-glucosidase [Candidatus Woesearchaeota archaeon]
MIILTNEEGFLLLAQTASTRFQGSTFYHQGRPYKAVEGIYPKGEVVESTNTLFSAHREFPGGTESYYLHGKGFVYENPQGQECTLVLDCRAQDDLSSWGRNYTLAHSQGCVVVTFNKQNTAEEQGEEYSFVVAVCAPNLQYKPVKKWVEQAYPYDTQRHSNPDSRWVYQALRFKSTIGVGYGFDKKQAIAHAKRLLQNHDKTKQQQEKTVVGLINKDNSLSAQCARASLHGLTTKEGIRAGIPWFTEYWSRDELISCKAAGNISAIVKKYKTFPILHKQDGNIIAADAPGWLFLRWQELMKGVVSGADTKRVRQAIQSHLSTLQWEDGLVRNEAKETWMDSIPRDGCRLEIQALTLAAMKLSDKLGQPLPDEAKLKERTRQELWHGRCLWDGRHDPAIRPNIFLAAYAYPDLLSKSEWTSCFKLALDKLWLEWGGLSTLDKTNQAFVDTHTGEDPSSYHNGDSWYWVNNLAAKVLQTHGGFETYVRKIKKASEIEITSMGAIGHHAEVSSAKKQTSQGCPSQAWSSAMFLELTNGG